MLATRFVLMFPERSDSLVLVNPIGLEDWRQDVPWQSVDAWYQGELKKTPEAVKTYMTKAYFDGQWKERYQPLLTLQQGWLRGPDYPRIAWNSARDRTALGRNRAPEGVRDQLGRYDQLGARTAKAIPDAKLVELEGIGHVPQYEAYDDYIEALTDFLE